MAFTLELSGALTAGAGMCWDPHAQRWDTLEPTSQQLGHTGTYTLHAGPCCAPSTGTTSPRWPRGALESPLGGTAPFHVRVGLFAEHPRFAPR